MIVAMMTVGFMKVLPKSASMSANGCQRVWMKKRPVSVLIRETTIPESSPRNNVMIANGRGMLTKQTAAATHATIAMQRMRAAQSVFLSGVLVSQSVNVRLMTDQ